MRQKPPIGASKKPPQKTSQAFSDAIPFPAMVVRQALELFKSGGGPEDGIKGEEDADGYRSTRRQLLSILDQDLGCVFEHEAGESKDPTVPSGSYSQRLCQFI